MKKNKVSCSKNKNLLVKENQKLTQFFVKIGDSEKKLNCTNSYNLNEVGNKKRRCNWNEDETVNCQESCVTNPFKRVNPSHGSVVKYEVNEVPSLQIQSTPLTISQCIKDDTIEQIPSKIKKSSRTKLHRTPTKAESPIKLNIKSPIKFCKSNVEVTSSLASVFPSKSNLENIHLSEPNCYEKIQSSIVDCLKNVSPKKLKEKNEKTPTRPQIYLTVSPSPSSAKIKLNFETSASNRPLQENNREKKDNNDYFLNITSFDGLSDDNWEGSFFEEDETEFILDLKDQQCKVVSVVTSSSHEMSIIVQSTKSNEKGRCILKGFWSNMRISIGDWLYISAIYDQKNSNWCVDNSHGFVVYNPSHLLSTTSVVGALFCKRKAFFAENFKGLEPPNKYMVLGVFVHELLQEVLKNNICSYEDIENISKKKYCSEDMIYQLYSSSMNRSEIEEEVPVYNRRIFDFVNKYVKKKMAKGRNNENSFNSAKNWKGQIDNVKDIEENIWCPRLGLKGKIDVTIESGFNDIPLELKTGRASHSLEHRGQIMLYLMMMDKLGYNVSLGLLLYLKEAVLQEIPVTNNEKRDLILLRNELTYYLTKSGKYERTEEKIRFEMPEPINNHSASACSKCPYNIICCSYLKYENSNLDNNKHLKELQKSKLAHLKPEHIEYFIKWTYLLDLESTASANTKNLKEIYTVPPEEREKKGFCIIGLKINEVTYVGNNLYSTVFVKASDKEDTNFYSSGIGEGNYIVVSTDTRPAVVSGFVSSIGKKDIVISLEKNLKQLYPNRIFYVDTYELNTSQFFNKICLARILDDNLRMKKLRELIIEKKTPTFQGKLSKKIIVKGTPILTKLNKLQQRAILKALATDDFLLVQGMPGSGKTATITALIELLMELDKTVLITSHTHSAIDNVCLRLVNKGLKLLRLGSQSRIHPKLHEFSEKTLTKDCKTVEQLEEVYNGANIVAVTCLGSSHPLISKRLFNVCIIDESTQIIQPSAFRAISACEKFVLVGDPEQLPPVVKNRKAIEMGLSESLFDRLQQPDCVVKLTYNYRMNKRLTEIANILTYNGELEVGNDAVANAELHLSNIDDFKHLYKNEEWLVRTLENSVSASFQVLDTGPTWNVKQDPSWYKNIKTTSFPEHNENIPLVNTCESSLVVLITKALIKAGVVANDIGIIAPYRLQVTALSQLLKEIKDVEVKTVDQFQGRDKDVIIYSCTKSADLSKSTIIDKTDILEDKRRLTVAVTRAKKKFILLGDIQCIRRYSPFKLLLASLSENDFIRLGIGQSGFSWERIFNLGTIQ